jgi:phosphohistidine phosphatase
VQLLVVRHAIAEDRESFAATGRDDGSRPLTADGARKMRRAARGLHEVVATLDAIVSSPLVRAAETAEILRREYGLDGVESTDVLMPDAPVADVAKWLAAQTGEIVAIVGHEPQLGRVVTYLVAGSDRPAVELKKGAACLIDFDGPPVAGAGRLRWAIPPSVLRGLAG